MAKHVTPSQPERKKKTREVVSGLVSSGQKFKPLVFGGWYVLSKSWLHCHVTASSKHPRSTLAIVVFFSLSLYMLSYTDPVPVAEFHVQKGQV